MQASNARFSTYSGAPSLQPSLAPTFDTQTTSTRSSTQPTNRTQTQNNRSTPIMSEKSRAVYNNADPAASASSSTLPSTDPRAADIKNWSGSLERMQDERLEKQRYVMSGNKSEEVSKLALGAKVERALARRMVGQDAQFTVKRPIDNEKRSPEVEAN